MIGQGKAFPGKLVNYSKEEVLYYFIHSCSFSSHATQPLLSPCVRARVRHALDTCLYGVLGDR